MDRCVGSTEGKGLCIAVVRSRFNERITQRLLEAALGTLREHGVADGSIVLVEVPGAVEIPLAVDLLLKHRKFDAVLCLGAVIRGDTPHFDYVCQMASQGIQQVSLQHGVPIAFGILTCDTLEQALARTGAGAANRGVDAALTALEMANLTRQLDR